MTAYLRSKASGPGGWVALGGLNHLPTFPASRHPPPIFTGREAEVSSGLALIQQRGVVAVTGVAGSGKTALAAALIQQLGLPTIWIEIMPGMIDTVDTILWQLARPLAESAPPVWRALHRIQQAGWRYPPVVRLQMILDAYASHTEALSVCIDSLEHVNDPAVASLVVGLCDYVAHTYQPQLKLVVAGRVLPYSVGVYGLAPLDGLSPMAVRAWAQQVGVALSAETAAHLCTTTGGLPGGLELLFATLDRNEDHSSLAAPLASPALRRLITAILSELNDGERDLLRYAAVRPQLLGALSPEQVAHLLSLEQHHLATVVDTQVLIQPLIRQFYQFYLPAESNYG